MPSKHDTALAALQAQLSDMPKNTTSVDIGPIDSELIQFVFIALDRKFNKVDVLDFYKRLEAGTPFFEALGEVTFGYFMKDFLRLGVEAKAKGLTIQL